MTLEHPLLSEEEVLRDLMYRSYVHNRERNPKIEASQWRKLYFNQELYEQIYQEELNEY